MPRTAAASGLTITQLEQMLDARKGEIQRLTRQRNKIARTLGRKLDAIDARIRALGGNGQGGGRGRGAVAAGGPGTRVRNEKSLIEMIEGVLGKSGKAMKVGDIADAVRAGGYRSNSANFRSIVNQTLIKEKRFGQAGRGLYQLKK